MTNNFNKTREFIEKYALPLEKGEFYFLQIFKRRKDNPEMKSSERLIDNFYLYNIDDFNRLEERIIDICNINNARACLRLNRRSDRKISTKTLKLLSEGIDTENYNTARNAYVSACGKYNSERKTKWLIDIDNPEELDEISNYVSTLTQIYDIFPSKNGYHIITAGFNPNELKKIYPKIDLHKDNMIVLYCP